MTTNDKITTLFNWCITKTKDYKNVNITNFTTSWRNGLGFCAILHRYGPEYIDYESLCVDNIYENCQIAFQVGEKYFGIPALLNAKDMVTLKSPDRLSVITYLLQYYSTLAPKKPKIPSQIDSNLSEFEISSDYPQVEDKISTISDENESSLEREQLICEICSNVIYFLEQLSVSDKYYHRACYRETQLSNLKARNKTLERPVTQTNVDIDSTERKSRLHSLSPEVREKVALMRDNKTPMYHHSRSSSPDHNNRLSLDDVNRSNNELESANVKQRLRSLSPSNNGVRGSSFDGCLEKLSMETSPSKSLHQFSTDRSSPSASSTHYVSVNASSTDSVPRSVIDIVDKSNPDMSKNLLTKIYPDSLNASSSSLNSSFSKKRRAPPPPSKVAPSKNTVSLKPVSVPKAVYPEDLNPFAEFEDCKSSENDTNPFAEFMTESALENPIVAEKIHSKPKKRLAPKIPPQKVVVSITTSVNDNNPELMTRVTTESEPDFPLLLPGLQESSEKEDLSNSNQSPPKYANETSSEGSSSVPIEIKNENTQTSESIKEPEPVIRSKHLLEKSKSNDSLNYILSSRISRQKPPAPSRPAPQKREVRGDTSHEFIPYESLYSELEEINRKQSELESKGRSLQESLKEVTEKDEQRYELLLQEWLDIVEKKNAMYSKEHHLHEVLRRQELEDRHSDLEYELRVLMGKQESLKSATEKAREEELINQILDTVNARAQLVEDDEELPDKSATGEQVTKKSSLKKIFSGKHRSNSLGKTIFRFKTQKKSHKTLN